MYLGRFYSGRLLVGLSRSNCSSNEGRKHYLPMVETNIQLNASLEEEDKALIDPIRTE